jgi:hypothetical protein
VFLKDNVAKNFGPEHVNHSEPWRLNAAVLVWPREPNYVLSTWNISPTRLLQAFCAEPDRSPPPFCPAIGVAYCCGVEEVLCNGVRIMAGWAIDIMLFSCISAFVTGIILAAAKLLI